MNRRNILAAAPLAWLIHRQVTGPALDLMTEEPMVKVQGGGVASCWSWERHMQEVTRGMPDDVAAEVWASARASREARLAKLQLVEGGAV